MLQQKPLDLFKDIVSPKRQHPIYQMMKSEEYAPERAVLTSWSQGFQDRDGKFCHEFQTCFEPCLWELYLHAYLKEIRANIDFSFEAPDFVATTIESFIIEATIAGPHSGGKAPYGYDISDMPKDLNHFNSEITLRICNSFTSKVKKYRERYAKLPQSIDKPFVIAIASFNRPFSHMAATRPIISALYGIYHDEEQTIAEKSKEVVSYNVDGVFKNRNTNIDLGYFCSPAYSDVSAVIYSCLATWGKIRALADNLAAQSVYVTFHPNPDSIQPIVKNTPKAEYKEHLLDGLWVFHNPFASRPLDPRSLAHERLAQGFVREDGKLDHIAPDDFLLLRYLQSFTTNKNSVITSYVGCPTSK